MQAQGRDFTTALPGGLLEPIQSGVLRTRYRGVLCRKSPFDLVLYLQLIGRLRPRTVIEIGASKGGSALWFADQLRAFGLDGRVVSVDLAAPDLADERITFLGGDANDLASVLSAGILSELHRPWLVVEDSAHLFATCVAVLEFFHPQLERDDYIVVEDGILEHLPGERYAAYENGPNRAVEDFLDRHPDAYEIDEALCDFYGHNVTWSPNAWLRRVKDD